MGSKVKARELAKRVGVPIVPGTEGGITDVKDALAFAKDTGYPVMIKASAGGGGRGLRVVRSDAELRENMEVASREAQAAFGDGSVFIEKYIERPHHIEFQILADRHGNIIHLGERDCSIQRRHQKLIEIAPSLILTPHLRAEMGEAAIAIAKAVNYDNAGTVEFLLDQDSRYYFMEMNPRLQVEHTVTEQITAIDIVRNQIAIAAGMPLEHSRSRTSRSKAMPSSAGSMRKTRRTTSCPAPAPSRPISRRAESGCASTERSTRTTRYRPTTTPCWPSSPCGAVPGKKPSAACDDRSKSTSCAG